MSLNPDFFFLNFNQEILTDKYNVWAESTHNTCEAS